MIKLIDFEEIRKQEKADFLTVSTRYISSPATRYEDLKEDFKYASHFKEIEHLQTTNLNAIIIKAPTEEVGLLASLYVIKKYQATNEDEDLTEIIECILEDFGTGKTPIVREQEYIKAFLEEQNSINAWDIGIIEDEDFEDWDFEDIDFEDLICDSDEYSNPIYVSQKSTDEIKKSWFIDPTKKIHPIIVLLDQVQINKLRQIQVHEQPIIYLAVNPSENQEERMQQLIFEENAPYLKIPTPTIDYYTQIMHQTLEKHQVSQSAHFSGEQAITKLLNFRGKYFKGNTDVVKLTDSIVEKLTKEKKKAISSEAVSTFFPNKNKQKESANVQLQKLVGLKEAKHEVAKIVQKIQYNKKREAKGLPVIDNHFSAAFLGSPGTAKTTFAKMFAKVLVEEGILAHSKFKVATRTDLIGEYVGHTAPKVRSLFEKYKGGFIFIDEAYSLYEENTRNFTDEALSELVFQMEENPNTFVVFAGYTEEMQQFIELANEGLKSRLTNIVYFEDYSASELIKIFQYFVQEYKIQIEDLNFVKNALQQFIQEVGLSVISKEGNGRLIRKLFQLAVESMVKNEERHLNLLTKENILVATGKMKQELQNQGFSSNNRKIGF